MREADPAEFAKVNDRFDKYVDGYSGKRLQVTQAEQEAAAAQKALFETRTEALTSGDGEKALEALRQMTDAERKVAGDAAFEQSKKVHESWLDNPITRAFTEEFNGRKYGELAQGDGVVASILHFADLGRGVAKHLPEWETAIRAEESAKAEKRVKEAREAGVREGRASVGVTEIRPDLGSGSPVSTASDNDFLNAYGSGQLTAAADHKRAMQLTGIH